MDDSEERLSNRVVESVASRMSTDPLDLPPLYEVIDPDALDALFRTRTDSDHTNSGSIRFVYAGTTVVAHADGKIKIGEEATNTDGDEGTDRETT